MTVAEDLAKQPKGGLNPNHGMVGSIAFFFALFSLANPNQQGYEQFRTCHGNCVNGVLHAIGMPLAVSGVFLVVRAASDSPDFTRQLQLCVVSAYLYLYLKYEPNQYSPWIFYISYMSIFDGILFRYLYRNPFFTRTKFVLLGLALVIINVGALETVGHGVYENHHSYVLEFFNSVFHTPLYGINSVMTMLDLQYGHACW